MEMAAQAQTRGSSQNEGANHDSALVPLENGNQSALLTQVENSMQSPPLGSNQNGR
jgi:hypothetical protein